MTNNKIDALKAENTKLSLVLVNTQETLSELAYEVESLEELLEETWKKLEHYYGILLYNYMLRGESRKKYEDLKTRVLLALDKKEN